MLKQSDKFKDPLRDFMARDENEIDLMGKLTLMKNKCDTELGDLTLIGGPMVGIDWGKQKEEYELWECKIIIQPIRKYLYVDGEEGLRLDQFICGPANYLNTKRFEKYFDKEHS